MVKKGKEITEIVVNLLFSVVVISLLLYSFKRYAMVEGTILGAGTFPVLIGILVLIFSILNLIRAFKKYFTDSGHEEQIEIEEKTLPDSRFPRFDLLIRKYRVIISIIIIIIYTLLMSVLGFIIATLLFIPAMLYLLEYRTFWKVVLISILGTAFLYLSFGIFLGVSLPVGLIFK